MAVRRPGHLRCYTMRQDRLDPLPREMRLGQVVISADFRRLPPRREIADVLAPLADEIAGAMRGLPSEPTGRTDIAVPVNVDFVRFLELIAHRGQLESVLAEYVRRYNTHRPHRSLGLQAPQRLTPIEDDAGMPEIERRDLLGGLVHEYMRAA